MGTFVFSRLPLRTARSFTASISSQCPAQGLLGAGKEDDSPHYSLCRHSVRWLSITLSPPGVSSSATGEQRRFDHLWWHLWDLRFVCEAVIYLQLGEHSSPSTESLVVGILGDLGVLSGGHPDLCWVLGSSRAWVPAGAWPASCICSWNICDVISHFNI